MDFLKRAALLALLWPAAGCQFGYYMHSAYHQARLARSREPIADALAGEKLTLEQKEKLRLVQSVKSFGEEKLGLKATKNYTSYVQLDEPYVTYVVQAAFAYELKPYLWHFPFVGAVPYKGYFRKALAEEEAEGFDKRRFDTFVRGVSAYSTLGWFQDSVLSSMLRYDETDLAETILHETVHATLFIKSAADFNERMATFLGHEGMLLYYREKEGPQSPHVERALAESEDRRLFSAWISRELDLLKKWYEENKDKVTPEIKASRLKQVQDSFAAEVRPKLKTGSYGDFEKRELNNAILLAYKTYEVDLEDFHRLHERFGHDYARTLAWLKTLEGVKKPDQALKDFVKQPL